MALPIIPVAHFNIKHKLLPNGYLLMKPFTVGQENIILQIKDSKDMKEIMGAIRQVIKECVIEPVDFDVYKIPYFLIELIFLRLRERSNGEIIDLRYICNNEVKPTSELQEKFGFETATDQDEKGVLCKTPMKFSIDLREVDVEEAEGHETKFMISEDMGIKLKYPTVYSMMGASDTDDSMTALVGSLDCIFQGDEVWQASESSEKDLKDFVAQIPLAAKAKIVEGFFSKMPRIKKTIKQKCPTCGFDHTIQLEGMQDFFV